MWKGPGQDPGGPDEGGSTGPLPNQELIDLKDQFEQQQVLIAQLKEMLRKSEQTTVTAEKVEEYANTLTKMTARAKKVRAKKGDGIEKNPDASSGSKTTIEIPAKEKIMLLRQQLEENKVKLAERGKNQKGIEEMVTQLKAQLDDSQQLISQTPLNVSLVEPRIESYSLNSSVEELYNILLSKDKRLAELNSRIQKLEGNVLDLQENLKEKDSVIDARTKAITLMTESLSKKGKNTLDALDDTKEQMRKMQENFVSFEIEMKNENQRLLDELNQKNLEVEQLRSANSSLEQDKHNLLTSVTEYQEEIQNYKDEVQNYELQLANLTATTSTEGEEVADARLKQLTDRVQELEALNTELLQKGEEDKSPRRQNTGSKNRRGQKSKTKESSPPKTKEPSPPKTNEMIKDLQNSIEENKTESKRQLEKISELENTIENLNSTVETLKTEQGKSKIHLNTDFHLENEEITKLKKQIDESNKNMIKVKAQHKSKMKELQKKIDAFKKISDSNAEIVRLESENSKLSEQLAQLKTRSSADGEGVSSKDSSETAKLADLQNKLQRQADLLNAKNQDISTLEDQITLYASELGAVAKRLEGLSHLENVQVKSEMTSIHFEEQMDKLESEKAIILEEKEHVLQEKSSLLEEMEILKKEKQDLSVKLDSYVQENMELIDKLEKLSAEKVSSAESIEMVENLTQQEKLELEAYQKHIEMVSENIKGSEENLEQGDLNDSVNQLTEETSDLLRKIELFTEERREVMEKMEALATENNYLNLKLREIENNRDVLAETYEQLQNEKELLDNKLEEVETHKRDLLKTIENLECENKRLKESIESRIEVKHGDQLKEDIKLETVTPLQASNRSESLELRNEIEEYKMFIGIQKEEIRDLKLQLLALQDIPHTNMQLNEKISLLQAEYENLLSENEKLNKILKDNSKNVHEKDAIESDLVTTKRRIVDLETKLTDNLEEIENYKSIVEESKNELISSSNVINDLQNKLKEKQNELVHYESELSHLNSVVAELNMAITKLSEENEENASVNENMARELNELKMMLKENIKQLEEYEMEVQQNSETIASLNNQLKQLSNRILETEHLLNCKDDEIKKVVKERDNKEIIIKNLQEEIHEKDVKFHKTCGDLKEKYLQLQDKIEHNAGSMDDIRNPLEARIKELESKNREQLDKMKKIAANLKKKTTAYQELETKFSEASAKWEVDRVKAESLQTEMEKWQENYKQKEEMCDSYSRELQSYKEELDRLKEKFAAQMTSYDELVKEFMSFKESNPQPNANDKLRNVEIANAHLSSQLSQYIAINDDLQNIKLQYEMQLNSLSAENEMLRSTANNTQNTEISQKDEIIFNLNEQMETLRYNTETSTNALQAKIQELEMYIETQDGELTKYKEKVNKLEDGLSTVEERRLSLERKALELGAELEEKSHNFEEISQTEDILEQRLAALMAHDEIVEKRLHETIKENQQFSERNRILSEENDQLKHKLSIASENNLEISVNKDKAEYLEAENTRLNQLVASLENDHKRLHNDFERKLNERKNEVDSMETELQNQLEAMTDERKNLLTQCEQLGDQLKEYVENQKLLNDEIFEYQQKIEQQQDELETQAMLYQKLEDDNKKNLTEIEKLKQQSSYQSTNEQNQNISVMPDQIKQLQKLLSEKDAAIESYQKQNLQLQMQGSMYQNEPFGLFGSSSVPSQDFTTLQEQMKQLELIRINLESHIQSNNAELEQMVSKLKEFELNNSSLQAENSKLMEQVKVLENHLMQGGTKPEREIALSPSDKTNMTQNLATFVWPEQTNEDPFNFISVPVGDIEPAAQSFHQISLHSLPQQNIAPGQDLVGENTKEELLKKIKTLEFMLFSVEKDKDDALLQCHELSNELTRLIYEREAPSKSTQLAKGQNLESQVLVQEDCAVTTEAMKKLQNLEFADIKLPSADTIDQGPVVEEIIQPKTAYLCYDDEQAQLQAKRPTGSTVDLQIIPPQNVVFTSDEHKQLQKLEFGETIQTAGSSDNKPITEKPCEEKSAYVCYHPDGTTENAAGTSGSSVVHLDPFGENDDGWGWGPEEAKLEEEHRQTSQTSPPVRPHLEELEETVRVLELERENRLEEIRQLQIKSGKFIKKLKEFKLQNDKLTSKLKKSDNFSGLEDAIQDELNNQITALEKKMKEINTDLDKERQEKNHLLKRVDVLTLANERMLELKEKQDIEVMSWQQRNRELTSKLEQFEWGDDSPAKFKKEPQSVVTLEENPEHLNQKIQELNEIIKELTLDNEELQALLEDQRNLRISAEKSKSVEPMPENMKTEAEYLQLLEEKNLLSNQLVSTVSETKVLREKYNNSVKNIEELQTHINMVVAEKAQLEMSLSQSNETINALRDQIQNYQTNEGVRISQNSELEECKLKIVNLEQANAELHNHIHLVETNNQQRNMEFTTIVQLEGTIEKLNEEKTELFNALQEKNIQLENMTEDLTKLNSIKSQLGEQLKDLQMVCEGNASLTEQLNSKNKELAALQQKCTEKDAEFEAKLATTVEQLAEEWTVRVDQRGSDIAESWKLHVDTRENEFMQLEEQLRKEIYELEEKCNALVNENNELRKNVDAEIRNEVDRVSALQQQINDRQQNCNELTKAIQDKQNQIEKQQQQIAEYEEKVNKLNLGIQDRDLNVNYIGGLLNEKQLQVDELTKQCEAHLKTIEQQMLESQETKQNLEGQVKQKLQDSELINEKLKINEKLLDESQKLNSSLEQQIEDKNKQIEDLTTKLNELQSQKESETTLQHTVLEYQQQITNLNAQLQEQQLYVANYNQQLDNYQQTHELIQSREQEINNLKALLDEKEREFSCTLQNTVQESTSAFNIKLEEIESFKRRLAETETHYEEMLHSKDSDLESLRLQLQEQVNKYTAIANHQHTNEDVYNSLQANLQSKTEECEQLQNRIHEQNLLLDEENHQLTELRQIIEEQVFKIEELKHDSYTKSKDYDSLIAELDIRKAHVLQESKELTEQAESLAYIPPVEDDPMEPVSRAELDLALYMLHQRDVRCEELTVELMQLLEERDTLQLKLSNAIRAKEELRTKLDPKDVESESVKSTVSSLASSPTGAVPKSKSTAIVLGATRTELATEAMEGFQSEAEKNYLANKLSELKSVGYRKDKTLLDEQDRRRLQQLSLMQQHRDVASLLPAEAAAKLVHDANYTLSRDVQSPSKVLLNWLWGRSTPKVNNI